MTKSAARMAKFDEHGNCKVAIESLREENARLRGCLERLQWCTTHWQGHNQTCPICGGWNPEQRAKSGYNPEYYYGHKHDCELAILLGKDRCAARIAEEGLGGEGENARSDD